MEKEPSYKSFFKSIFVTPSKSEIRANITESFTSLSQDERIPFIVNTLRYARDFLKKK